MPTHHLLNGFSYWGLQGLHDPPISGLVAVKAAGYTTLEVHYFHLVAQLVQELSAAGIRLIVQASADSAEDLRGPLAAAKRHGALFLNVHAGSAFLHHDAAVELAAGMIKVAEEEGVKLLFETHRGRITQDPLRTVALVQALPQMRLTLDVSHFVLAGERVGVTSDLRSAIAPLVDRVDMIHGRVSNGQQIQVDIGDGTSELADTYKLFWADVMRSWRMRNAPGSALVFTPELGPPRYAITHPTSGDEISDRWQQSLVLRELAKEAWRLSATRASDSSDGGKPQP